MRSSSFKIVRSHNEDFFEGRYDHRFALVACARKVRGIDHLIDADSLHHNVLPGEQFVDDLLTFRDGFGDAYPLSRLDHALADDQLFLHDRNDGAIVRFVHTPGRCQQRFDRFAWAAASLKNSDMVSRLP